MMNTTSNPPWEDLPQELLSTVANFLTSNPIDILAFRAICKSWNSSSPPFSPFNLSRILPIISPTLHYRFDMRFARPVSGRPILSVTAIFALPQERFSNMDQDKNCWLMFVDQLTPGKLMIRQPLTKYSYSMPLNFPSCIDVSNIHVEEIARFYNLSFHPATNKPPSMWSEYVQKVVVNSDESRAFALFHTGKVGTSKMMLHPNWVAGVMEPLPPFGFGIDGRIDDIVYHKNKLLGVDHLGRVYVLEFPSFTQKMIESPITESGTKRKRLIESNGLIYLVIREETSSGLRFKVFEVDENLDEGVEVYSVGDMVFFFGLDFSFSVSPNKLGGSFRNNCIVYIEHSFKDYDEEVVDDVIFSNLSYGDLRVGVWHMDEDPYHYGTIGSYPGYSNVLWPPPTWLWSVDMSKRTEDLETALDDLLINAASAEKLKAMAKALPSLEHVVAVNDNANQEDSSEITRAAQKMQVYLKEAKYVHKHLESIKLKTSDSKQHTCKSLNLKDQASGSSSHGNKQVSVSFEAGDAFIASEMKLNGILLYLEETTTKLQNTLRSRQQPSVDAVE